jgi:hypothetical protein
VRVFPRDQVSPEARGLGLSGHLSVISEMVLPLRVQPDNRHALLAVDLDLRVCISLLATRLIHEGN